MVAEFFLAIFATDTLIGGRRKAFGVPPSCDLPAQKQEEREGDQCPRIGARDENEGREHHCEVPVVDAAIGAASIFHKPSLEGAEKQNADHIAHAVSKRDKHKNSGIDDLCVVEHTEDGVESDPSRCHREGARTRLQDRRSFARGDIIAGKLLLATGAFEVRREKAKRHFHREDNADGPKKPGRVFIAAKKPVAVTYSIDKVYGRGSEKEQGAKDQLDEMHRHNP